MVLVWKMLVLDLIVHLQLLLTALRLHLVKKVLQLFINVRHAHQGLNRMVLVVVNLVALILILLFHPVAPQLQIVVLKMEQPITQLHVRLAIQDIR